MPAKRMVVRGLIAGLIGATVLAVWFFVIDSLQGRPFYTPAFLSNILVHTDGADRSFQLIALYTLLHYAAFCVVGLLAVWLLQQLETSPSVLLGIVLGFVLFDLVFYLSVVLTGVDVVERLGWPPVLTGNVLAGIGMMGYLHWSLEIPSPNWVAVLSQNRIIREGTVVGVIGALVVATWFLVIDLIRADILFTPGALGSAVFLRAADASAVEITLLTVGGYTILHFLAFIAVGMMATTIVVQAEKVPALLLAGVLIFATAEALFIGLVGVLAEWLLGALGWVSVGVGNLLAATAMAVYLWRTHPSLRDAWKLRTLAVDAPDEDEEVEVPATERTGLP